MATNLARYLKLVIPERAQTRILWMEFERERQLIRCATQSVAGHPDTHGGYAPFWLAGLRHSCAMKQLLDSKLSRAHGIKEVGANPLTGNDRDRRMVSNVRIRAIGTGLRIAQNSTEVTSDTMIFVSSARTTFIKTVTSISMASSQENVVLEAKIGLEHYENIRSRRQLH